MSGRGWHSRRIVVGVTDTIFLGGCKPNGNEWGVVTERGAGRG